MKVAVIGNGNVGLAVFRELQRLREVNELVLGGRNKEKINAGAKIIKAKGYTAYGVAAASLI